MPALDNRPEPARAEAAPRPPSFDPERARRKLFTTAGIVLAVVAVGHLALYLLLTRDARAGIAAVESRHAPAALEAARPPTGEPQAGSPGYRAWRQAKALWVDAETWRSDRRQATLLRHGILGSFLVQLCITAWILVRLLGGVRRRARTAS